MKRFSNTILFSEIIQHLCAGTMTITKLSKHRKKKLVFARNRLKEHGELRTTAPAVEGFLSDSEFRTDCLPPFKVAQSTPPPLKFTPLSTNSTALVPSLSPPYEKRRYVEPTPKEKKRLLQNMKNFVVNLPPRSPIRKPVIKRLSNGVRPSVVASTFDVSPSTISRAKNAEESVMKAVIPRYPSGVKRKRIGDDDIGIMDEFLDEYAPFLSGRHYRLIPCPFSALHRKYLAWM